MHYEKNRDKSIFLPTQEIKAMDAHQDVSIGIHLQEVTVQRVKHQTSGVKRRRRLNHLLKRSMECILRRPLALFELLLLFLSADKKEIIW